METNTSTQAVETKKTLSPADFENLKSLMTQENTLHKRIIDLKYSQINLDAEEKKLNDEIEELQRNKFQINQIFAKNYGRFTSLDVNTGEYTIEEMAPSQDAGPQYPPAPPVASLSPLQKESKEEILKD